jgi:2-polyprenyl-3-methyl-5-hydroxy-6-metoxy-1,4-benzoquinol methylase
MLNEIKFSKYESRGAYHWEQISRSIRRHNAFVSARYDAVLSALRDAPSRLILDIGGGDGALSYLFARQGAQTITTDAAQVALQYAREEFARRGLKAQVVGASAYALPFPNGTFDAAICSDVIEHVQSPWYLIMEAARILKPRGRFVLTTPLRITEKPLDHSHVREFFAGEIKEMMTLAFDEVEVTPFAPLALKELFRLPFPWLGGRPLFRYLFNAAAIYLRRNPFAISSPFHHFSMLIATGRNVQA